MKLKNQQISIKCYNRNVCVKAYKKIRIWVNYMLVTKLQYLYWLELKLNFDIWLLKITCNDYLVKSYFELKLIHILS